MGFDSRNKTGGLRFAFGHHRIKLIKSGNALRGIRADSNFYFLIGHGSFPIGREDPAPTFCYLLGAMTAPLRFIVFTIFTGPVEILAKLLTTGGFFLFGASGVAAGVF